MTAPFLQITSDGGRIGRICWRNTRCVFFMGIEEIDWGFAWIEPIRAEIAESAAIVPPRHVMCRCGLSALPMPTTRP